MREHGLSFDDWGETFSSDISRRIQIAKRVEQWLADPQFQEILDEMEYNVHDRWRRIPIDDKARLEEAKSLLLAIQSFRRALKALVSDKELEEQKTKS